MGRLTVPEIERETVLVTGASAGIGADLAREFAAQGARLVLVARRLDRLETLAAELGAQHGVPADCVSLDLTRPDAVECLLTELDRRGLAVDVLVNNAGFGARGAFAELSADRQRAMLELNVTTLVGLTRALLPGMLARRRGGVLNVASTAAFQPGPYMAVYYATKAFVQSFTEALHEELRKSGVTATALCPGATETEFGSISGLDESPLFRRAAVPSRPVARAGVAAFRAGRALCIVGWWNRLGTLGVRLAPRALVRRLVARFQGD